MVRTSTGPAESDKQEAPPTEHKRVSTDRGMQHKLGLDEETWSRIVQMATSQSVEPDEVVRRAIVQTYGAPLTTGTGFNSGHEG